MIKDYIPNRDCDLDNLETDFSAKVNEDLLKALSKWDESPTPNV